MTLHDAMKKLLQEAGRAMSTKEIAGKLNENQWYQKKNGSKEIIAYQIYGRAKRYSDLFNIDGTMVSLNTSK